MPLRSSSSISNACTSTISASVESSPPDRPTTAVFACVWRRRVARPVACSVRISSQRSSRSALFAGTNGVRGNVRSARSFSTGASENDCTWPSAGLEGVHALTLVCKALEINIGINDALREHFALGQQCAVLRDEVVARKNEVLRGLTETGIRIQIRAQQSARLLTNKVAAVACLADDLIRSRQVDDNVRAHLRQRGGRRVRHPQVLADLHAKREQRLLFTTEDKMHVGHNMIYSYSLAHSAFLTPMFFASIPSSSRCLTQNTKWRCS